MKKRLMTLGILIGVLLSFSVMANADTIMDLDYAYTGDSPAGSPPWLTLAFSQNGTDPVTLTLTANLQNSAEFITNVYFNVSKETISSINWVSGPVATPTINYNSLDAPGDGFFDVILAFPQAPPGSRFNGTDVAVFSIEGQDLTPEDFNSWSVPKGGTAGPFRAVAHVQGITGPEGSGHITEGVQIPEPGTLLLLGAGLLAVWVIRRRK
jgi:hypothetical protein